MDRVCPGGVETPMTAILDQEALHPLRCRLLKVHLLERFAKPEKIAGALLSLSSDDTAS